MLNYFTESDNYLDTDTAFYAHDAELEMKAANDEARFEHEAEEAHTRLWEGFEDQMEMDRRNVTPGVSPWATPIDDTTAGPIVPECDARPISFGMELSTTELLARMRRPARRIKHVRKVA